jgi:hypothetical protein
MTDGHRTESESATEDPRILLRRHPAWVGILKRLLTAEVKIGVEIQQLAKEGTASRDTTYTFWNWNGRYFSQYIEREETEVPRRGAPRTRLRIKDPDARKAIQSLVKSTRQEVLHSSHSPSGIDVRLDALRHLVLDDTIIELLDRLILKMGMRGANEFGLEVNSIPNQKILKAADTFLFLDQEIATFEGKDGVFTRLLMWLATHEYIPDWFDSLFGEENAPMWYLILPELGDPVISGNIDRHSLLADDYLSYSPFRDPKVATSLARVLLDVALELLHRLQAHPDALAEIQPFDSVARTPFRLELLKDIDFRKKDIEELWSKELALDDPEVRNWVKNTLQEDWLVNLPFEAFDFERKLVTETSRVSRGIFVADDSEIDIADLITSIRSEIDLTAEEKPSDFGEHSPIPPLSWLLQYGQGSVFASDENWSTAWDNCSIEWSSTRKGLPINEHAFLLELLDYVVFLKDKAKVSGRKTYTIQKVMQWMTNRIVGARSSMATRASMAEPGHRGDEELPFALWHPSLPHEWLESLLSSFKKKYQSFVAIKQALKEPDRPPEVDFLTPGGFFTQKQLRDQEKVTASQTKLTPEQLQEYVEEVEGFSRRLESESSPHPS